MQTYKQCTDEKFEQAMADIRNKPYSGIADDLLYIAFTKYAADYVNLARVAVSSYHYGLLHNIKIKRNAMSDELTKREISHML